MPRWIVWGIVVVLQLTPVVAQSEGNSWWLRLRSTGYVYQTDVDQNVELDHFNYYQHFDGSISGLLDGKLTFRASGRFADDLVLEQRTTDAERLYLGYAQLRLPDYGQARLGRQFIHEGPTHALFDGLWLQSARSRRWQAQAWGGASTPTSRIYEAGDFDQDPMYGARLKVRVERRVQLAASWASRERNGEVDERPVGLETTLTPLAWIRVRGDAFYETELEEWQRVGVYAQARPAGLPSLSFQFVDRRPQIGAASYFARFGEVERIRLARTSLRHTWPNGWGAAVEYFVSDVDTRTSYRVGGSVHYEQMQIGYSVRLGDAGEENRWYGDLAHPLNSWLSIRGGATVATYTLLEDAPASAERDLVTAYASARAVLRPGLTLTTELQSVENPFYSEDFRVLIGLDVGVGRGNSRFGLDRGGWLR